MPSEKFEHYRPDRDYTREELLEQLAPMPRRLRELLTRRAGPA